MGDIAIKFENISKQYRLGEIGTGTLSHDLNRWWYKVRGKEDPYLKVGSINVRNEEADGEYIWALRDINLEVKQGEVLGIIGKNGAGKSTLLKILSKVTRPTTGIIKTKGRIASLLEVGTGFHPEMTGRENVFMNGSIMGMTNAEIKRKFDEIVDFAGVERYIDTPVKRYSSGMTVRLGFAIAAHLEPEILVIDEVLSVGDAEFQKKALGKIQDISTRSDRTTLFVSHNMAAVQNLCSSAILLIDGKIELSEDVEKCIALYKNSLNIDSIKCIWERKSPLGEYLNFIKAEYRTRPGKMLIYTEIVSKKEHKPAFIAFDFLNSLGVPLFQSIPSYQPFIYFSNKSQYLEVEIDLPVLIPDTYYISLWVGPHFNITFDWEQNVLKYELLENPIKERIVPYSLKHGNLILTSKLMSYGAINI